MEEMKARQMEPIRETTIIDAVTPSDLKKPTSPNKTIRLLQMLESIDLLAPS